MSTFQVCHSQHSSFDGLLVVGQVERRQVERRQVRMVKDKKMRALHPGCFSITFQVDKSVADQPFSANIFRWFVGCWSATVAGHKLSFDVE